MRGKVKFGIIGCGRIAQRHAKHISEKGELVAVCDIIDERAKKMGKEFNARHYNSVQKMLEIEKDKIDVISICSPNGLHAEHSIRSLEAGFNTLCEKPLATSIKDCESMILAAERSNKRLFVIKQNRFNPPVAALKHAIDEGKLGKINSVQLSCFWNRNNEYYENTWKGSLDMDGGTLFTQFSHFVDLLYWIIGDIEEVKAYTNNYDHKGIIEFEDTGVVILKFQNGAIGTINYTVNSFEKNMEGSLTVFGESGTVKVGGQYLNELEYQNIKDYKIENLSPGNKANNYGTYYGSMSNHGLVYDNLIDVICNGGTISTNSFEGLKTVEIIEKIYNSVIK